MLSTQTTTYFLEEPFSAEEPLKSDTLLNHLGPHHFLKRLLDHLFSPFKLQKARKSALKIKVL